MEYYKISQAHNINGVITIPNNYLRELERSDKNTENAIIIQYKEKRDCEYLDYIEVGAFVLVSDELKKLFSKYEKEIKFRLVVLIDQTKEGRKLYWIMDVPLIDCLSGKSEFSPGGIVKSMVLDKTLIDNRSIFAYKTGKSLILKKQIIINLDVAESILRRNIVGINYERLVSE
jgi:hypothetical protein